MPSNDPVLRLQDILDNINRIEQFTAGMDLTGFANDLKTSNATERCLERISEAAKKLGDAAEELCPAVPWPKVRALGNLLRHEYDIVDVRRVWLMVENDLAPLKTAVQDALTQLGERGAGRSG